MSRPDHPERPAAALPPVDELDELASALLDGEVGPDDEARLADPAVRAEVDRRRARLDAVRTAIAEPVDVDPGAREAAIAAALAAAGGSGDVADVGDELAARRARAGRGLRVAGAAAAVVAVLAVGVAVLGNRSADDDLAGGDAATEALDVESAPGASPDAGPRPFDVDDGALAPDGPVDLGDFSTVEGLLAQLSTTPYTPYTTDEGVDDVEDLEDPGEEGAGGTESTAGARCAPGGGLEALVATATVLGEPVEVWAGTDGTYAVVDPSSCAVVDRTLP